MASTVWSGQLAFGLVSIPIRLTPAARAKRIPLRRVVRRDTDLATRTSAQATSAPSVAAEQRGSSELTATRSIEEEPDESGSVVLGEESRVQAASMHGGEAVPADRVEHAFEFQKDRYLPLDKTALSSLAVPTSSEISLSEFVKLDQIDPVYFETSYFVVPTSGGERPYSLLYRAMSDEGFVGIASVAMHRREHTVVLRPGRKGLLLHTLFYADEVRSEQEFAAAADINAKELKLATTLIQSMTGEFDAARYKDSYREKLQALIDSTIPQEMPAAREEPVQKAAVVSIIDSLNASLALLKKTAAKEEKQGHRVKPVRRKAS